MPGITVTQESTDSDVTDDVLRSVCFDDSYARHYVIDDDDLVVAHTGYDEYPVEVFETDEHTLVLEGHLYGTTNVEETVQKAATLVCEGRTAELSEWAADRDGDFLLVIVDRSDGTAWAVNDAFGRLPTYRATVGETTVVTRELKVVRELARALDDELEPDTLALGQMLLFGYPLGTRTLFESVEQLPPGSLLEIGSNSVQSTYEFQFDTYENADQSVVANARHLRDRFVEACENRASVSEETIISLSGGLDSRAAIAGYTHADGSLRAATSARKDGGNAAEVNVARQVANALDVPWQSYIADRTDYHRELLLDMTQGMNNLSMSLGLDFADQVAADHKDATFVTGDGGDKAIPDLTPTGDVESMEELVDTIVTGQHVFSLEEVTTLVDVEAPALINSIRERLASYPESTLDGKHIHFLVRERGINWLNHGEDRTRYYLWSTTPFYSLPFFTAAMACPPEQKRGTHLYREFLSQLSPAVLEIDYVDFGAPIDSLTYRVKRYGYDWLSEHPALKERVIGLLGGSASDGSPPLALAEATGNPSEFERYFSSDAAQRITWSGGEYTNDQQYLLLTLIAALTRTGNEGQKSAADSERTRLSVSHRS